MWNPFRSKRTEVRAITEVPWDQGGTTILGAQNVTQDRALSLAPVFAATRIIAGSISTLPLKAHARLGETRVPAQLPQFLRSRQLDGTLVPWLHEALVSQAVRGNTIGLVLERDRLGYPTWIEWINPSDASVDDSRSAILPVWYVNGREVPRESIFHIPWFKVPGRTLSLSPIGTFAATINTGLYAQAYGNDWFEGGGFPPGQMRNTVKGGLTQAEATEIRERTTSAIRERRPLVTGQDWEYTPITVPPNEAQFIDTVGLSATQIANIYGLPPEDCGGSRGSSLTYATTELNQLERQLALRPWCVRFEHAFSSIMPEREYVRFNVDAMIRTDARTKWDIYRAGRELGIYNVDEIRAKEDMPPLPNGAGADYSPLKAAAANPNPATPPAGASQRHEIGTGDGATVTDLPTRWVTPA